MRNFTRWCLFLLLTLILSGCTGSGSTGGDPGGTDSVSVSASVTSLNTGDSSIITATVTRENGMPATDRTVHFGFDSNKSGGTLSVESVKCDASSKAMAIYTAGSNSPFDTVQDVIKVWLSNESSDAVVITRGSGSISGGYFISEFTATPSEIDSTDVSIILIVVTDTSGHPVIGETVTFTIPVKNTGSPSLSSFASKTDAEGKAVVVYSPGIESPNDSVTDALQATLSNGSNRIVLATRKPIESALTANTISFTTTITGVAVGDSIVLKVRVTDASGNPVGGITVTFALSSAGSGTPSLSDLTKVTDGNGEAFTVYTAGGIVDKSDVITATITGADAALVIKTQ